MGGFFGAVGHNDVLSDVYFGTDYHSHLGTKSGGLAAYDPEIGLQRNIHNIQNTQFRTKFGHVSMTCRALPLSAASMTPILSLC